MDGTPPGTPSRHPHSEQRRPTRAHAVSAGSPRPHRPHPGHTGRGTLAAHSRGRAAGGGTAPDTRRPSQRWQATPPRGQPLATPVACSHHRACRPRGQCSAPTTTHPRPQHVGGGPQQPARVGGQSGEGQRLASDAPHNDGRHPPGDALLPPPQRATPARRGACCGTGAGSPRPHRPHPGHTGRGTLAAHSTGRAAGGGTAPDTRRPSQRWQAPPRGTPCRHPHSEQRQPARAHAVGPVLGPHARTDRTRDTRVAEPWPPAQEDRRPGEGQRLTAGAPRNGGRPPGRGQPPTTPAARSPEGHAGQRDSVGPPHPHTRAHSTWVADPNSPPNRRAVGGGTAPDLRRLSHDGGRRPPRGHPSATPTASNADPQGRTLWGR